MISPSSGDLHFGTGNRGAHRVELDVPLAVEHRNPGDFRLAVNLFQIYPQGMKEPEVIGPHGGPAGIGVAHPGSGPGGPAVFENDDIGQPAQNFQPRGTGFFSNFKSAAWYPIFMAQLKSVPFDPGGIQMFDLHGPGHLLVHPAVGRT